MYNHVKRLKKSSHLQQKERMLVDLANTTMNYPVHPLLTPQQTVSTLFMFSPLIYCGCGSLMAFLLDL